MDEINRLVIRLPWPDTSLMPNRKNGKHWASTHQLKVRARQSGYFSAMVAMKEEHINITKRVQLKVTFVAPDNRSRDLDNLLACIKPQLDGVASALGIDDKLFRPIVIDDAVDVKREGFLIVEIG